MTWLKDMWLNSRKATRRMFLIGVFLVLLVLAVKWSGSTPLF
jgi:hypothetical protein